MRNTKLIILLFTISYVGIGQTIDTVDFWGDWELITDLSLNDNGNCFEVDTTVGFHACNNYHGQEISLTYYPHLKEFCDSINAIESFREKYNVIANKKRKELRKMARRVRLIGDHNWSPQYYYSPEILFYLKINGQKYNFNSITESRSVERFDLSNGIEIEERIPNAYKLYGKVEIKVILYSNKSQVVFLQDSTFVKGEDLASKNPNEIIEKISIEIVNECSDRLIMYFFII